MSGYSDSTHSGAISVSTDDSGVSGVSGPMSLSTGKTTAGTSGKIELETGGDSLMSGDIRVKTGEVYGDKAGDLIFETGSSSGGVSGNILVAAGESKVGSGGDIDIFAGNSSDVWDGAGGTFLWSLARASRAARVVT